MIYTFIEEALDVCTKYNVVPKVFYEVDDVTVWSIDVPEDHALVKDPDFLACIMRSMLMSASIVRRRMAPPLFVPTVGGVFATTVLADGTHAVPVARRKDVLEFMMRNPKADKYANWVAAELRTIPEIRSMLTRVAKDGIDRIIYFVAAKISETIPIKLTLEVLEESKTHDHRSSRSRSRSRKASDTRQASCDDS